MSVGDFPEVQVRKVVNSSDVSYTVSEDTRGVPDMDTISLLLEGHVSQPVTLSSLTESSVCTTIPLFNCLPQNPNF